MATRKNISKKTRFEIFKRDCFTCQYCGKKAPDVILELDHIKPVSKGGKNTLLNYVTACFDCNRGKSDKELDDKLSLIKARAQAEFLQTKREQIQMMAEWQMGLLEEEEQAANLVNEIFQKLTSYSFTEEYKNSVIKKIIRKYGVEEVINAFKAGLITYDNDPKKVCQKITGICICRADPVAAQKVKILNKLCYSYGNHLRQDIGICLTSAYNKYGVEFYDFMERNYYEFSREFQRNVHSAFNKAMTLFEAGE